MWLNLDNLNVGDIEIGIHGTIPGAFEFVWNF